MSESRYRFAQRFSSTTEQRLEEIRQILREAEPIPASSILERLDVEAIEDRRVFKRRFGYDWPLRFHREALVTLRQERDWTDGEVKLFLLSGTLQRSAFGVRPAPSTWIAGLGAFVIVNMLVYIVVVAGLLAERIGGMDTDHIARGGGVVLLFLGIGWLAYQVYVRPWRILRRSMPT